MFTGRLIYFCIDFTVRNSACRGLTWQLATKHQTAARSLPSFPPQWGGKEKWTKAKTCGLRWRQLNKTTKEGIIVRRKTMQNKRHTAQFLSPPNNRLRRQSPSSDCRTRRCHGARRTHRKVKLLEKDPAPQPAPVYMLSMTSVVRSISTGQPGLAAWLCSLPAPAHLLFSQTWETEKRSLIS